MLAANVPSTRLPARCRGAVRPAHSLQGMELDEVVARGRLGVDLTDPAEHGRVRELADALVATDATCDDLTILGGDVVLPIDLRVATKLAASKRLVAARAVAAYALTAPSIVVQFAMWGEHRRLRPRSRDNPLGEDSLRAKLDQLDWLLASSDVTWRLVAIDDGCPYGSADIAQGMATRHRLGDRVTVLRLDDVVPTTDGPLAGLVDPDASRKGGAMLYGATHAMDRGADAVVYTDADSSVDLGQIGLLLAPFAEGVEVAIGDRKHPDSVLVKAEARWGPGIVVLRHMQRMVARALFARGLRDTQAAFKLYSRAALRDVLAAPSTFGFAFDSDWLYAALANGHAIATTPFAFVDSLADSASITQGPMTTWRSLLVGLTASARARGADHDEQMAAIIDDWASVEMLEVVVQHVPPQLQGVDPAVLGDPDVMSPAALRAWLATLPTAPRPS